MHLPELREVRNESMSRIKGSMKQNMRILVSGEDKRSGSEVADNEYLDKQ
jgi:hypothetical protein